MSKQLFKVEKWEIPNHGHSRLISTFYYLAISKSDVENHIIETHGFISHYYSMDRIEERFEITELTVKEL